MASFTNTQPAAKTRTECIMFEISEEFQAVKRLTVEYEEKCAVKWKRMQTLFAMLHEEMKPFPDREFDLQQPTESSEDLDSNIMFETEYKECPPTPARRKYDKALHGLETTHLLPNEKRVWKCYCRLEFKSYEKMKKHFIKKTQRKLLRCSECWKRFHLGYQLKAHRKRKHGLSSYSCSMCFLQFENEEGLKQHLDSSFFEADCGAKLREKKRKHEPFFTPLQEGTYGLLSVRNVAENYDDYDFYGIKTETV